MTIHLVASVSPKRSRPAPARDLYRSAWFLEARRYVEAQGGPWFILSARHGLVAPQQTLAPYNQTLNGPPIATRRAWAALVQAQMDQLMPEADRVVVLAGLMYRELLMNYLMRRYSSVEIPMEGMGIGQQLRWLSRCNGLSPVEQVSP